MNKKALDTTLFKKWFKRTKKNFIVNDFTINKVHMFGPNVGFIDLTADVTDQEGTDIPGICMLRGNSVAVLTVLVSKETAKEYFVLTRQPRIPTGREIYEIPAGMTDGKSSKKTVVEELGEEVGAELNPKFEDLTFLISGFNSPGLLDEITDIYLFKKVLFQKKIDKINNRKSGLDNERIITELVDSNSFLSIVESIPSKLAFYAYKAL